MEKSRHMLRFPMHVCVRHLIDTAAIQPDFSRRCRSRLRKSRAASIGKRANRFAVALTVAVVHQLLPMAASALAAAVLRLASGGIAYFIPCLNSRNASEKMAPRASCDRYDPASYTCTTTARGLFRTGRARSALARVATRGGQLSQSRVQRSEVVASFSRSRLRIWPRYVSSGSNACTAGRPHSDARPQKV
jgi:hypothetical protein